MFLRIYFCLYWKMEKTMSVSKRKTSAGVTEEYHYAFMQNGKRFFGVCEGCKTKAEAEAFENNLKKTAKNAAAQKTPIAIIENFRQVLTGGEKIPLDQAFKMASAKPRKKNPSANALQYKKNIWMDFVCFMNEQYPNIEHLAAVTKHHAEEYISLIRESGRYKKEFSYQRNGKTLVSGSQKGISSHTANFYLAVCKEVFTLLASDAGLTANPFNIVKLISEEAERQAFSEEELILIRDHLDDFTRPLFSIAIATALREGDICTLKWSDVDFHENVIRRKMNKTGLCVEIPISADLKEFLLSRKDGNDSDYIFPVHAEMYQKNPSGVSYRIKAFLEKLGIKTTVVPKGRTRAVSVKDLHSCRHTFCYYAGLRGIPLSVVQGILGHMSPEMTKRYNAHASLEAKRKNMRLMENFMGLTESSPAEEPEREELRRLADSLPIETVREMLKTARG